MVVDANPAKAMPPIELAPPRTLYVTPMQIRVLAIKKTKRG
jgi:hypothetical protein